MSNKEEYLPWEQSHVQSVATCTLSHQKQSSPSFTVSWSTRCSEPRGGGQRGWTQHLHVSSLTG